MMLSVHQYYTWIPRKSSTWTAVVKAMYKRVYRMVPFYFQAFMNSAFSLLTLNGLLYGTRLIDRVISRDHVLYLESGSEEGCG